MLGINIEQARDAVASPTIGPYRAPRRKPADVLAWVIDTLDGHRRPRRPAHAVLSDVVNQLDQAARLLGTPSAAGDTLAVGSLPVPSAADTSLRTSSPMQTGSSWMPGPLRQYETHEEAIAGGLEEIHRAKQMVWEHIEIARAQRGRNVTALTRLTSQLGHLIDKEIKLRGEMKGVPKGIPPQWEELKQKILSALQKHPEARKDVLAAMQEPE